MPPFLIFLPVRNGGHYVAAAIESVLAQSHGDWRLLILENGSIDGTPAVLERYCDRRISVISAAEPLPIYGNWHRALAYLEEVDAQEEIVAFLGHDDLFYPDFLRDIAVLAAVEPDATIYQTLFDLINENGAVIRPCRPVPAREGWHGVLEALCWGIRDSFGTGYAFRARDYRAIGGIPDLPRLLYADHLMVTRATARGGKACTGSIAAGYRLHRGSASGAISVDRYEAEAEALSMFAAAILDEFPTFLDQDGGRAAFASLLARGTFALGTPAVYKRLSPANRRQVDELVALFPHYARGVAADAMVGPPIYSSRLILQLRRANQTLGIWKQRLRRR